MYPHLHSFIHFLPKLACNLWEVLLTNVGRNNKIILCKVWVFDVDSLSDHNWWQILTIHSDLPIHIDICIKVETRELSNRIVCISVLQIKVKYSLLPLLCNSGFCPFFRWNLDQIWNPMTVLKSAHHNDFKIPPTCSIWWRYARLKARLHFQRSNKSWDEIKFWSGINCL